ncbi:MAG TPA: 4Fe-4S binding protein [Rhodocyclaceae bacterium]
MANSTGYSCATASPDSNPEGRTTTIAPERNTCSPDAVGARHRLHARLTRWSAACLVLALLAGALLANQASAGELTQADIERRILPPLRVAAKLPELAAWPITSELEPEAGPVAYVFESIDFAPIPGFEGTPFNLLVTLDRDGRFVDVEVLRQHEPVFLSGLGEAPLLEFVRQYAGKSLHRPLSVSSAYGGKRRAGEDDTVLDGVTKATASVRILNQTVLNSGLAVARARLGFGSGAARGPPAQPRMDFHVPRTTETLLDDGSIARLQLSNHEAERLFQGTEAEGSDAEALRDPDGEQLTLTIAYLNPPTIGRALLGDARYAELMRALEANQPAFWIATRGRTKLLAADFVPGTTPPDLVLTQDGLSLELRDFNHPVPDPPGLGPSNSAGIFVVPYSAGLDPGSPMRFELGLRRAQGMILPRITKAVVALDYAPPAELFTRPPPPPPEWLLAWQGRAFELAIIGAALLALSIVLARPRWISIDRQRLRRFRIAFLAFTLVFIGWIAQGQLSVVQITGAIKSLLAGGGLGSFLYDPVSLLLIAFTLVSFVVWGRGTFCGWLCPFGALQEFAVGLRERLGLREIAVRGVLARALRPLPFLTLTVLLASAAFAPAWAERLVEVEPFKTAITVAFDRAWPFVAYAVVVLVTSAFVYKGFCRFLCPLGAAMALGGRLRRFDWLTRRRECGTPCQMCRRRCRYDAIETSGTIRYADCFQCLDCVGIYHDEKRCAPLVLYRKRARQGRWDTLDTR